MGGWHIMGGGIFHEGVSPTSLDPKSQEQMTLKGKVMPYIAWPGGGIYGGIAKPKVLLLVPLELQYHFAPFLKAAN